MDSMTQEQLRWQRTDWLAGLLWEAYQSTWFRQGRDHWLVAEYLVTRVAPRELVEQLEHRISDLLAERAVASSVVPKEEAP